MIDANGQATLYCWVPKAAMTVQIYGADQKTLAPVDLSIMSVRRASLLELIIRALAKNPRKFVGIGKLFLIGNRRGVSFRFARLAEELNALPYRLWLDRHLKSVSTFGDAKPTGNVIVLITLEMASNVQTAVTENSLARQAFRNWRKVERGDLPLFRSSGASHEFLWLPLPAGAVLAEEALEELVKPFSSPEVSVVYPDEDRLGFGGRRHSPFFKPAWSPLLAKSGWLPLDAALIRLSSIPHEIDISNALVKDVILSVAEPFARSVLHVPKVLLSRTITRIRTNGPERPAISENWRPKVTIIIPSRDRLDLLSACMEGLRNRTKGAELDIIIIDNDSREPATLAYLRELQTEGRARVINMPGEFNFARACNVGVAAARHDLILLLNNDVDPISPDWLVQMAWELSDETVGAVGAYLLYPDGFVQHAGVTLGAGSIARHSFSFIHPKGGEDRGLLRERRDVSAVTGACMLTTRSLWQAVGGMDEEHLTVAFNDVDYCLKLRRMRRRIIWTPFAKLWHRESVSRGKDDTDVKLRRFAREEAVMFQRWGTSLKNDPFHNPNLSKIAEDFVLEAFPEDLAARGPSLP